MKNLKTLFILFLLPAFLSAQASIEKWTADYDKLLKTHVTDGRIDYASIKGDTQMGSLVTQLDQLKPSDPNSQFAKAFYINAYNLLVIYSAATNYPVGSVQEVSGFFERNKYSISGKKYTLNGFEKDFVFKKFPDPRLHFVLVCGALGCPPITDFAYQTDQLEAQLDAQTKLALDDPNFIRVANGKISLSQIFKWYSTDFGGGKKEIVKYLNKYRSNALPSTFGIDYYPYDWSLNDTKTVGGSVGGQSANAFRYVTSATIPKGQIELKIFNNLFSQKTASDVENLDNVDSRSTFYTASFSALYGINQRFNLGVDLKYRRTLNSGIPSSALDVFKSLDNPTTGRTGITGIGPRIRWAPFPKFSGFSLQSTFTFAIGDNLEGTDIEKPFIDWDENIWWTQFFFDKSIGSKFSFFAEVDVTWEDIGDFNKLTFPVTTIFSYFPDKKVTLYALAGYAPTINPGFDYFHQVGLGTKYQVTRRFEIELLYTSFQTQFVKSRNGSANTFNLGLRYSL